MQTELKKLLTEKLLCFECNGAFQVNNENLECTKCSKKFFLNNDSISYDNPAFESQYGSQFRDLVQTYEQAHSLDDDFSSGIALTIKTALERLTILPVQCALELGCGTGVLTRGCNYHRIAEYIFATDISIEMLNEAARRDSSNNVIYLAQDACELNFKSESFDIVVGAAILHHLTWLESGLKEIFKVLTHNGVAVFMEPLYYGNQFVVFLMSLVVEHLKHQRKYLLRKYPLKNLLILEKAIFSYSQNLKYRHENRNSPENLATSDDKQLFTKKDLKSLAKKIGFKNIEIISLWHLTPQINPNIFKSITIEVIDALKKEVGLENFKIDYSGVLFFDIFNDLIGDQLLEDMPPQAVLILQK